MKCQSLFLGKMRKKIYLSSAEYAQSVVKVKYCICIFQKSYIDPRPFLLIRIISDSLCILTLLLLNTTCPVLTNSVDPDQLASEEAN